MKAQRIVFTAPEQTELQPFELEEPLQDHEILVETLTSLISPGTEGAWYSGLQRDLHGDDFKYPIYSGYCHAGRVVEMGSSVETFQAGDQVVTGLNHASFAKVSLKPSLTFSHTDLGQPVASIPTDVPLERAPFAKMAEIAITAVRAATFSVGDTVLVTGLGMVGNLAAQLFQLAGAEVMATDLSAYRLQKARECGIERVVNPSEVDLREVVMDWTGGRGVHVAVESVGLSELILENITLTRQLGEVVLLGTPRKKAMLNPTPAFWQAHMRGITIKGALRCLFYPLQESSSSRHSVVGDLEQILQWFGDGRLKIKPLHTHTLPPSECQAAYQGILKEKDTYMGVVFDWRSG